MPLALRHIKGVNGLMPASVKAIPNSMGTLNLAQVCGAAVILGSENNLTPQQVLRGHDDIITAYAMSHGGGGLATGQRGRNADVVLWDLASLQPKCRFQEHDTEIASLAFSADDRLLASFGNQQDCKLFVLDTATGKIVSKAALEPGKRVSCSAWCPAVAGRVYTFASAAGEDLTVWTLDPFSGQLSGQKVTLGTVRREFVCLQFSPDGAWLYCGTTSADVVTVNVQRRAVQMAHPVCNSGVGALLLAPDGSGNVIAGGRDGTLSTFSAQGGSWRELRPFATVPGAIGSLSLSADQRAFIVGTMQGAVYRLDRSSMALNTISSAQQGGLAGVSFGVGAGDAVATCSTDNSVCVWGMQDFTLQCRVQEPSQAGGALCCLLTRDSIISGWGDGTIRCHARTMGGAQCAPLWIIPGAHTMAHSCGVTALRLSNNGTFLLSGGAGGELRVWDMRSREMVAHLKMHMGRITDVAVMADDAHIAAASEDRRWSLWDVAAERVLTSWQGPSVLKGMAVSPDRVSVVTVSIDRKVQMWDVRTPDPRWTKVEAHGLEAGCVASDHRGATFATGGADRAVKVWDWRTGAELASAAWHTGPVVQLAYSPDDRALVSVAADGTVAFWELVL